MVRFSGMRGSVATRVLLALLAGSAAACGEGEAGFRIDNVSVTPNDFPINSTSTETLDIRASVYNDRQEVLEVLARSDEADIWIDLLPGRYPRWSAEVPIFQFQGYEIGDYWLDFEARDASGRFVRLEDAVRIEITED